MQTGLSSGAKYPQEPNAQSAQKRASHTHFKIESSITEEIKEEAAEGNRILLFIGQI